MKEVMELPTKLKLILKKLGFSTEVMSYIVME